MCVFDNRILSTSSRSIVSQKAWLKSLGHKSKKTYGKGTLKKVEDNGDGNEAREGIGAVIRVQNICMKLLKKDLVNYLKHSLAKRNAVIPACSSS